MRHMTNSWRRIAVGAVAVVAAVTFARCGRPAVEPIELVGGRDVSQSERYGLPDGDHVVLGDKTERQKPVSGEKCGSCDGLMNFGNGLIVPKGNITDKKPQEKLPEGLDRDSPTFVQVEAKHFFKLHKAIEGDRIDLANGPSVWVRGVAADCVLINISEARNDATAYTLKVGESASIGEGFTAVVGKNADGSLNITFTRNEVKTKDVNAAKPVLIQPYEVLDDGTKKYEVKVGDMIDLGLAYPFKVFEINRDGVGLSISVPPSDRYDYGMGSVHSVWAPNGRSEENRRKDGQMLRGDYLVGHGNVLTVSYQKPKERHRDSAWSP
jgi:hypothetical protein